MLLGIIRSQELRCSRNGSSWHTSRYTKIWKVVVARGTLWPKTFPRKSKNIYITAKKRSADTVLSSDKRKTKIVRRLVCSARTRINWKQDDKQSKNISRGPPTALQTFVLDRIRTTDHLMDRGQAPHWMWRLTILHMFTYACYETSRSHKHHQLNIQIKFHPVYLRSEPCQGQRRLPWTAYQVTKCMKGFIYDSNKRTEAFLLCHIEEKNFFYTDSKAGRWAKKKKTPTLIPTKKRTALHIAAPLLI